VIAQGRQYYVNMMAAMDALSDRKGVRVVVLIGSKKCFSARADLKANRRERSNCHQVSVTCAQKYGNEPSRRLPLRTKHQIRYLQNQRCKGNKPALPQNTVTKFKGK
tara:strand:- start:136 stop:456 length:321 start_codon:yes stop_codon:yes gene_type:complete